MRWKCAEQKHAALAVGGRNHAAREVRKLNPGGLVGAEVTDVGPGGTDARQPNCTPPVFSSADNAHRPAFVEGIPINKDGIGDPSPFWITA